MGNELIDTLKIMLPHVTDLEDIKKYKAHVILEGRGISITMPSMPNYLLETHKQLFEVEHDPCPRTQDSHAVEVNKILEDPARLLKRVILLLPDGMMCSADMFEAEPSRTDQEVEISLRRLECPCEIGMQMRNQIMHPAYWTVRILEDNRRLLTRKEKEEYDYLERAFAGMKV